MTASRKMKLACFFGPHGEHLAAWRHSAVDETAAASFDHYLKMAELAERALLDLILVADVATSSDEPMEILSRLSNVEHIDPLVLISALAARTRHIGLTATASTTYNDPYHVARKIASIDHVSGGRAGWNVVTTQNETDAYNFGHERHAPHGDRYARAEEFVDVVTGLWDTWEDDAFIRNKQTGQYFRPDRYHLLCHQGSHFAVRGPLDVPRTPQGRPIIVQAGSSDAGRELSSRVADVVFTQQLALDTAQAFYRDVKQRAVKHGRAPDEVVVILGLMAIVGRTEAEARAKQRELDELIHPAVAIAQLSKLLGGIDLSPYSPDDRLPVDLPPGNGITSRRQSVIDLGEREGLSMLQLALRLSGARAHWTLVGTAKTVADQMEAWFQAKGTDGYLLVSAMLPRSLHDFAELVVPELQRRGLMRTRYEGRTLRENLGLDRPAHPRARQSNPELA